MRTTVTLDEDVARAVEHLRNDLGTGISETINALVRRGLASSEEPPRASFEQTVSPMGLPRVPLDDIEETLSLLEGDTHR